MRLEFEKKKLEFIKVSAAKAEMEFRILEKEEEINKIRKNIQIQNDYMIKLNEELNVMKMKENENG